MAKRWYKIVDKDNQDRIKTLYHSNNHSKFLERKKWLTAELKDVKDGSGTTVYTSGWHIMSSPEACKDYLKLFTRLENKVIVRCMAKDIAKKHHSKKEVYLATEIKIDGEDADISPFS